ncbi:MAG TPA: NUDIX hydrolase [Spirochaetota bacterium]
MGAYRNPVPTVDIIIKVNDGNGEKIVLIKRKNPPFGWALPGGFVDYGETLENAAQREAKEETNLDVRLIRQFHAYSDPARDKRQHTISVVFIAEAEGVPVGMDDAVEASLFSLNALPTPIAFDHETIIQDYIGKKY